MAKMTLLLQLDNLSLLSDELVHFKNRQQYRQHDA
jgi:hypothetical protein